MELGPTGHQDIVAILLCTMVVPSQTPPHMTAWDMPRQTVPDPLQCNT